VATTAGQLQGLVVMQQCVSQCRDSHATMLPRYARPCVTDVGNVFDGFVRFAAYFAFCHAEAAVGWDGE